MLFDFIDLGKVGIVRDSASHTLPVGAWSDGNNVRFTDGKVQKFKGYSAVFGSPSVTPKWMMPVPTASTYYWLYMGSAKAYVHDGTTHTDITRTSGGDYSPTDDLKHTGGILGGIPFVSNGADTPQVWALPISTSTALAPMKWDATYNWGTVDSTGHTCRAMRAFKSFLVALDVNKAGARKPYLVKWSHPAEPGAEPVTWDEADTTKLAGEVDLAQSPGFVVDCLPLGNTNVIYKEDSIWGMQFIGGNDVFRFFPIYFGHGILSTECVVEVDRRHVVLTPEDLIIHDTQSPPKSLIEKKWRTWLVDNLDKTNYRQSYLAKDPINTEVWVCIPTTGALYPDKALVWNWRDNTVGLRDIPNAPHVAYGAVAAATSSSWDDASGTLDTDSDVWDTTVFNPTTRRFLIAGSSFYKANDTNQEAGVNMTSYVERQGISFGEKNKRFRVKRLYLQMEGTGLVNVYLKGHDRPDETISYGSATTFNPTTDRKLDITADGFFMAIKIESTTDIEWAVTGIQFEVEESGDK